MDQKTLTAEQSRAARAWLNWSQSDLANESGTSLSVIRDFEKGREIPVAHELAAIQRAIESAGIMLVFGEQSKATGIMAIHAE
jgi:ribosome-binding protein aMBF1 (putative translation factor)